MELQEWLLKIVTIKSYNRKIQLNLYIKQEYYVKHVKKSKIGEKKSTTESSLKSCKKALHHVQL